MPTPSPERHQPEPSRPEPPESEGPRPEYPRPHFDRSHSWLSLNGSWDFLPDPDADGYSRGVLTEPAPWPEQICVPFAWETEASGVTRAWLAAGWYRRDIQIPEGWTGQRVVLHFGAVHHAATVWVNGSEVGHHEGGYTPFALDITDTLHRGTGTVVVGVRAPVDKRTIAHGKQRSIPADDYDGCSFTPSSGIWQPVWLEARPATHISAIVLRPTGTLDGIDVDIEVSGPHRPGSTLTVHVAGDPRPPVQVTVTGPGQHFTVPVTDPHLWEPADPHLYSVDVQLTSPDGTDRVTGSTGLRTIRVEAGQLLLNGQRLYLRGVLDQGYWPATGITAPTDQAFIDDLVLARSAGYNLVRKHLKLEDPRFFHHADRLGMLTWAEPASTGIYTDDAVSRFEAQIEPMVTRDANHPSIVIWGLYNEEWGLDWDIPGDPAKQEAVRRAFRTLKLLDPTRPAVDNSGWTHVDSDIADWHVYDEHPAGWATKVEALMTGDSDRFPVAIAPATIVDKLLMAAGGQPPTTWVNLNSEYGGGYTSVDRGWNLRWQTQELRRYDTLGGYVWTELYDIEHETAGLFTSTRHPKDLAGADPAAVNAVTVPVVDLIPTAPGSDLTVPDRTVDLTVRISHHGPHPVEVTVTTIWGPHLGPRDEALHGSPPTPPVHMKVEPFHLSEPITVQTRTPGGPARLHVLLHEGETLVGSSCVDVVPAE